MGHCLELKSGGCIDTIFHDFVSSTDMSVPQTIPLQQAAECKHIVNGQCFTMYRLYNITGSVD